MAREFFQYALTAKPALWQAILAFNGFVRDAPPPQAWLSVPGLDQEQAAALWGNAPRLCRKNTIFRATGPEPFWDFAEESRRLALLDQAERERLVLVFGAALHAESLARVVLRTELLALQAELGPDIPSYAQHRGRFQLAASPAFFAECDPQLPLAPRIRLHGLQALEFLRSFWPETLRQRCPAPSEPESQPLPGDALCSCQNLNAAQRAALWQDMKKILLKEVAPAWTPCFD